MKKPLRFLIGALAVVSAGCVSEVSEMIDDSKVIARVGVLANVDYGTRKGLDRLEKALRYYRQSKVDAVAVIGADVPGGRASLDEAWQNVFAGRDVRLVDREGKAEVRGFSFAVSERRPRGTCEVLTFYGGRQLALTDELCFYPREWKAICAGSMHGVEVPEAIRDEDLRARAAAAAQGLLVVAYADRTVVRRLDFTQTLPLDRDLAWKIRHDKLVYAEEVGDPWVIGAEASPSVFPAPEFWPDTRIRLQTGYLKGEAICTVKWPSVQKRGTGVRARWYEVGVAFADDPDRTISSRTVLTSGFFLSEDRDTTGGKAVFRQSELPCVDARHSQAVFTVTPVGAFGKHGKTFRSGPIELPRH